MLFCADNTPYEKIGNADPVSIADEVPFDIPDSWEWVRLCNICNVVSARRVHQSDWKSEGVPFYRAREIGKLADVGFVDNELYISEKLYFEFSKSGVPQTGDLMVTAVGTLGKIYIVQENDKFYYKDASVLCFENFGKMSPEYLKAVMQSPYLRNQIKTSSAGTTVGTITIVNASSFIIPVPPLKEQNRIISKLKSILPLLSKYEQMEERLGSLNNGFPDLLKKSILQMAVQGKLVPQDENDEPASMLLERIRAEKQKLIAEGKIKKDKNESVIFRRDNSHYEKCGNEEICIDDDLPFEIPDSWEWARLNDIVDKEIKRGKSPTYISKSSTLVFAQKCNVKSGGIDMSLAKYLDEKTLGKYPSEEFMQDNDIVVNSTGTGTMGRIGHFHVSDNPIGYPIVPDSHVTVVRLNSEVSSDYIVICLQYYQKYLEEHGEGSTNQKELKAETIKNLFIPIPPFNEQIRVVNLYKSVMDNISIIK